MKQAGLRRHPQRQRPEVERVVEVVGARVGRRVAPLQRHHRGEQVGARVLAGGDRDQQVGRLGEPALHDEQRPPQVLRHVLEVRVVVGERLVGLVQAFLRLVEAAEHREDDALVDERAERGGGHADAFGHRDERVVALQVARVAELDQRHPLERGGDVRCDRVVEATGDRDDLVGELVPFAGGAEAPDRVVARPQPEAQRVVVAVGAG